MTLVFGSPSCTAVVEGNRVGVVSAAALSASQFAALGVGSGLSSVVASTFKALLKKETILRLLKLSTCTIMSLTEALRAASRLNL